jgi:hypothetical protein
LARPVVISLLLLLLLGSHAGAALTLSRTTPTGANPIPKDPCPDHAGAHCWVTASDLQVIRAGTNAGFEASLRTPLPGRWDPTGWTFTAGASVNANANVVTYQAYNGCGSGEGVELEINRPAGSSHLWVQVVQTNRSNWPGLTSYLDTTSDPNPTFQPPLYPWQGTAAGSFYDKPGRECELDQHITWNGYLYLADVSWINKTVTYYDGIFYGFTVDCVLPEPGTGGVIVCGFGWLMLVRRTRSVPLA